MRAIKQHIYVYGEMKFKKFGYTAWVSQNMWQW